MIEDIDRTAQTSVRITYEERCAIEEFIHRESRLADEARYKEWEALWDSDGRYWVPLGDGDYDSTKHISIVDDSRGRIASRIRQLESGSRYAHLPASTMRRLISNVEFLRSGVNEFNVGANFILLELPLAGARQQRLWGGRVEYKLRQGDEGLRMFYKKVTLVNGSEPIPNLPAII